MKLKRYVLLPLVIALTTSVYAGGSAMVVSLPFNDQPVFSKSHSGIYFDYAMGVTPAREVICHFKNSAKFNTTVYYRNGNSVNAVAVDDFILTSKGSDGSEDGYRVLHADASGSVKATGEYPQEKDLRLSCHYAFDDNP